MTSLYAPFSVEVYKDGERIVFEKCYKCDVDETGNFLQVDTGETIYNYQCSSIDGYVIHKARKEGKQ